MLKESIKVTLCPAKTSLQSSIGAAEVHAKKEREMTECSYVCATGTSRLTRLVPLHSNRNR